VLGAFDALPHGVAFYDLRATHLHSNLVLRRMLESDPGCSRLHVELREFVVGICVAPLRRSASEQVREVAHREVLIERRPCRLRASHLGLDLFGRGDSIVVTVEPPPRDALSESELRSRFGLTRQECRVAGLLARGCNNETIAKGLHISTHTARHHAERIYAKLGVRSRAEATSVLLHPAAAVTPPRATSAHDARDSRAGASAGTKR
jgi:DNA-binding CsgD family transcriptional regulator